MISIIIITTFITKILASHTHAPVGQYVHVTAVPYPLPNPPIPPPPTYQTYQPYHQATSPKSSPTLAPTTSNTAPAFEITTPIDTLKPPLKKPDQKLPNKFKPLDSNVLNNLAIALQLLIVSNILNKPSQDTDPEIAANLALSAIDGHDPVLSASYSLPEPSYIFETPPNYVLEAASHSLEPRPRYAAIETSSMPNSKYLGTSSLVDSNVYASYSPRPSPRSSADFMSPYEALTTLSDPILSSPYGPYSKRDFKSPYAMMLESKELFSMSDLF